ncbi:MAG: CBS domain-containing protein [Actinomycetota bacterium]
MTAPSCGPDEGIDAVRARLGDRWDLCCVLGRGGVVLGTLRPRDLGGEGATPARDVMNPAPSSFRPDVPVEELRRWMGRHPDVPAAPVTSPEGRILGTVSRSRLDALHLAGTAAG